MSTTKSLDFQPIPNNCIRASHFFVDLMLAWEGRAGGGFNKGSIIVIYISYITSVVMHTTHTEKNSEDWIA